MQARKRKAEWSTSKLRAAQENKRGYIEAQDAEKLKLQEELVQVKQAWQQQQARYQLRP